MVRVPHIPKPRNAMAKRQLQLRQSLWPDVTDDWLWSRHQPVANSGTGHTCACRATAKQLAGRH